MNQQLPWPHLHSLYSEESLQSWCSPWGFLGWLTVTHESLEITFQCSSPWA